jgi:hypothetical protein
LWGNHWPSLGWARGIGRPCDGPGCNQATRPGYLHETASLALVTSNEAVLRTARDPEASPDRDVRMFWTVDGGWRPVWHVARPSTEAQVLKALDRVLRRSRWAYAARFSPLSPGLSRPFAPMERYNSASRRQVMSFPERPPGESTGSGHGPGPGVRCRSGMTPDPA